jgi:hypothetical protein
MTTSRGTPAPDRDDRRAFLRRASREAAAAAGTLAGLSAAVGRSMFTAATAAAEELRHEFGDDDAPKAPPHESRVVEEQPHPAATNIARPGAENSPLRDTEESALATPLTADQEAFLANGVSAALAVNDPGGAPSLTSSWFHWDGAVFLLPARMFGVRASNIARDPAVSLLIEDAPHGGWVSVSGYASIVAGPEARQRALPLVAKYRPAVDQDTAWGELNDGDDTAIIVVTPDRFVWQTR